MHVDGHRPADDALHQNVLDTHARGRCDLIDEGHVVVAEGGEGDVEGDCELVVEVAEADGAVEGESANAGGAGAGTVVAAGAVISASSAIQQLWITLRGV